MKPCICNEREISCKISESIDFKNTVFCEQHFKKYNYNIYSEILRKYLINYYYAKFRKVTKEM